MPHRRRRPPRLRRGGEHRRLDRGRGGDRRVARGERVLTETGDRVAHGPVPHSREQTFGSVVAWIDPPAGTTADGPLRGLRIGVKDNIDVAGVPSTCASAFFADRVATSHAEVVRRLLAAGARVTAKLNMAEFAVGVTSQNSAAGPTRNPWNPAHVPGGSSGGSGAAVAAGLVDAALGTDTGGSIRLPASACGVAGLRPTAGSVSNAGVYPVSELFDTVGPMARSVTDIARIHEVLRGGAPPHTPAAQRIGMPAVFITEDVDPAVAAAVRTAADVFETLGYDIIPIDIPGAATAQDVVYTLIYSDLAERHRERIRRAPELFQPATLERISLGLRIPDSERAAALARRDEFRQALTVVFDRVDAVLTPAMPIDVPLLAGGADVIAQSRRMGQFSYPWSLHDGPTLALPIGFHPASGMPIGAQLTAAAQHESMLFEIGAKYQGVTGWHAVRPYARPA
ncbi:amidase [Nocardia carnea]|uniref:amidase n=1 Tax=Nocardia carnea TaxID=37328 RepID=UPI0024537931|nr:amidase [Nocardia carnea]